MSAPAPSADRNLLFGILALQMDFVTRDQLVAAMNAWVLDKARPLGQILRDQAALDDDAHALLDALVQKHLARHGDDPAASLAALGSAREEVRQFADPEVRDGSTDTASLGAGTAVPSAGPAEPRDVPSPPPAVRYRVLRPHARGALGQVSVALDEELHREVALKEIQARHADHPESRARFLLEAEVTGGLEHPGVVPVYGLGTYPDGRPFYAMRFVRGESLLDAIRQFHEGHPEPRVAFDGIAFRQLLRRFVDVCNAVAYAHSRGVIHRDLKPANVMLGRFGETLVVDWGLAKPLGRVPADGPAAEGPLRPPAAGGSSATVVGSAVGTPAYMSPEQADGRIDELGPATDVYSLGGALYELLTGRRPVTGESILDVLEKVRRGDIVPPRQANPAVPPPLAAVCLKAMALRPEDRYPSALDLAREVERWLADEPVAAYPEPVGARVRRWVRKHARLATGIAAALAVGVAALGLLAAERERARQAVAAEQAATARERDEKEAERDRAVAARRRTRQALDDMVSGVTGESLAAQQAVSPEQKKFLERAVTYYEQFAAEPGEDREGRERLAAAHYRLAMIRARLGQREAGAAVFARAAELYAQLAADFPDAPAYRRELARSHNGRGNLLMDLGQRAAAEAAYRAAAAVQEKLAAEFPAAPEHRRDLATTRHNLGYLLADMGRQAEAEAELRSAVAVLEHPPADRPDDRRVLVRCHLTLGGLLRELGKSAPAEAEYKAALAVQAKLADEFPAVAEHRRVLAGCHASLAALFNDRGRRAEAGAEYKAALALQAQLAGQYPLAPEYRSDLARTHNNLANLLTDLGRREEAESSYRAAVAVLDRLADEFPAVPEYRRVLAMTRYNLGLLLADLGKRAEAETEYRAALPVQEKLAADFPAVPDHRRDLGRTHTGLGQVLSDQGKRAGAEAEHRAARAVFERLAADFPAVPDYRSDLGLACNNLGAVLHDLGRTAEAEAALRAALAVQEKLVAEAPAAADYRVELATTCTNLGDLLRGRGAAAAALERHGTAVALVGPVVAADPRSAEARQALRTARAARAEDYTALGRFAEALADWDAALTFDDGSARAALRAGRAGCMARLGRAADAVREAGRAAADPTATADTAYACAAAVSLAAATPGNPAADAHAARAVELLRLAVARGYRDVPHLLADADLAAVRGRADYAAVLWDLADRR